MSRPFAKYPAKPAFAQFNEPLDANEHIANKKIKYSFCSPNICHPNKNVYSQSNYLYLKRANNMAFYPCKNSIDKTQLYINLITKLDLGSNVDGVKIPVISDLDGNTSPVIIDDKVIPFLKYNIDPSGNLFGNSPCGITNFENYLVYDIPYNKINS